MTMKTKKAPKKVVKKIRDLAKAGKVVSDGDLSKIDLDHLDFTVAKAELLYGWCRNGQPGFTVKWETVSAGFGQFQFYVDKGKFYCDNELMDKLFIAQVLMKMVDGAELTCTREQADAEEREFQRAGKKRKSPR